MAVEIREINTRRDLRRFIRFANDLYCDCPNYCPPIFGDEMNVFDEKKNLNSLKMLEYGYYNLGFIAVSKSFETDRFLNWWHWKLTEHGYLNLDEHLAWDQKWCDLVPIYFDGVHILKNPGYNIAFWNIFERHISENQGKYWVNEKYPLRFIHFSHYMPEYPEYMRSVPIEDSFTEFPKNEPVLKALFDRYYEVLTDN